LALKGISLLNRLNLLASDAGFSLLFCADNLEIPASKTARKISVILFMVHILVLKKSKAAQSNQRLCLK
jgi:hypothetical protein